MCGIHSVRARAPFSVFFTVAPNNDTRFFALTLPRHRSAKHYVTRMTQLVLTKDLQGLVSNLVVKFLLLFSSSYISRLICKCHGPLDSALIHTEIICWSSQKCTVHVSLRSLLRLAEAPTSVERLVLFVCFLHLDFFDNFILSIMRNL